MTRFANYLHYVLPGNDAQVMVLAAKALGRLAIPGGTRTAEFVEFEIKRSLEWLQGERIESRRHAAALLIGELGNNAPTLVYTYVPQIFEAIWVVLRDPKVNIREAAAEALDSCLKLTLQRDSSLRNQWYKKLVEEAYKGFKLGSIESIHGSLLTFGELFRHTGLYLQDRYIEICDSIMKYKDHKESLIKKTVINLIPDLATFNSTDFSSIYLNTWMNHLLSQLKKEKEKSSGKNNVKLAFIAIGKISLAIGSALGPFLDPIFASMKEGLSLKL